MLAGYHCILIASVCNLVQGSDAADYLKCIHHAILLLGLAEILAPGMGDKGINPWVNKTCIDSPLVRLGRFHHSIHTGIHISLSPKQLLNMAFCVPQALARAAASGGRAADLAAISAALLLVPEEMLRAPPRPPLPSPPRTPSPPPLPTSQYAWDALGRPAVTDGVIVG